MKDFITNHIDCKIKLLQKSIYSRLYVKKIHWCKMFCQDSFRYLSSVYRQERPIACAIDRLIYISFEFPKVILHAHKFFWITFRFRRRLHRSGKGFITNTKECHWYFIRKLSGLVGIANSQKITDNNWGIIICYENFSQGNLLVVHGKLPIQVI